MFSFYQKTKPLLRDQAHPYVNSDQAFFLSFSSLHYFVVYFSVIKSTMAPAVKRKFKNKKLTEPPKKVSSFEFMDSTKKKS